MKRPLLLPLVPLYAAGLELRELRLSRGWESIRRLVHPVISIGNLSTGGSGKTPLTIALARLLSARGFQVDVLSRGYGRQSREPMRVKPDGTAEEFGDEPLLIAREAGVPVYVAAERYAAGFLAESNASSATGSPRIHILDDGFQHRQLHRDIDILLVNREDWAIISSQPEIFAKECRRRRGQTPSPSRQTIPHSNPNSAPGAGPVRSGACDAAWKFRRSADL